jgi:hypothetical protein
MTWKSILGLLIRCEISASRHYLGSVRVGSGDGFKEIWTALFPPTHEWYPHVRNGKLAMRRMVNGEWQYRELTKDEEQEAAEDQALRF